MGMIDIHVHILPGLDDGASTWEEATEMARAAASEGTQILVATPHFLPGNWPGKSRIADLVAQLQEKLNSQNISLQIYPGGEVYLEPELPERIYDLPFLGGQSKYLLVELPFEELPSFADEVLFKLRVKDIVPVLAHPERNRVIGEDLSILAKWIRQGALVQVNAGSLTGAFGRKVRAVAEAMVKARMVHFLGSDGHSVKRPPRMLKARKKIAELMGEQEAEGITRRNALALLRGEQIEVPEPEHRPRREGFLRFITRLRG